MSDGGSTRHAAEDRTYYGRDYYDYYNGQGPYERERWLPFFRRVAAGIVADSHPRTSIEFGCAKGFLVEALREMGVDALGVDFSPYAIGEVIEAIRPYCRVGDVREPVEGRYDIAICMEVLEHLDERAAPAAIRNLAMAADTVYFTSNPDEDFPEETHVNVQPTEYWDELFERAGMVRDRVYEPKFIADWALRYNRKPVDIIIPVQNDPRGLRWCLDSLYQHTDSDRFHLYLVDNDSDPYTGDLLTESTAARRNMTLMMEGPRQGGTGVRAINRALEQSRARLVIVLDSSILLTEGWLDRLLAPVASGDGIGIVGARSNRTEGGLLPTGYSFADLAAELAGREGDTSEQIPSALTGCCLLLTRCLIESIGLLDPIFSDPAMALADYGQRARVTGFRVISADSCYVYCAGPLDGRGPFDPRESAIFEARWGPISRRISSMGMAQRGPGETSGRLFPPDLTYDVVYYLPPTGTGVGGMISVVELVNRLILRGQRAMVATVGPWQIDCACLFAPLCYESEAEFLARPPLCHVLVATGHQTVGAVRAVCAAYGSVPAYFIQDYEGYFANGDELSSVVLTYEQLPHRIVVSRWLQDLLREQHDLDGTVIPLGVAIDEFYPRCDTPPELEALRRAGHFLVFAMLRGDDRRGAPYLVEAARRLADRCPSIIFVFAGRYVDSNEANGRFPLPALPNVVGVGLLDREAMARHLAACDVSVDASLYQGFGMLGIEAMAAGTPTILTRTGGALEYAAHEVNCLMVEPRDVRGLCDAILRLRDDPALAQDLANAGRETAREYDWADLAGRHAAFFAPLAARAAPNIERARASRRSVGGHLLAAQQGERANLNLVHRGVRKHDHFYTSDPGELRRAGYRYEGAAFALYDEAADGRLPLYRLYQRRRGDHLYSTDPTEGRRVGYRCEGIMGYLSPDEALGLQPLYRWCHPKTGDHLYGLDRVEGERAGYQAEGIAGFVPSLPADPTPGSPLGESDQATVAATKRRRPWRRALTQAISKASPS